MTLTFTSYSGGLASSGSSGGTGAPGDGTTCGGCHNSGSFGPPLVQMGVTEGATAITEYIPGETYAVLLNVIALIGTPVGYGFQATVLDASDSKAGDFVASVAGSQITSLSGREYAEHSTTSPIGTFGWQWTAPAAGTGTVTFYGVGNAVNGNGGTSGDNGSPTGTTITLTEGVAMPISLARFTADVKKQNVSLNWTTDMEKNTNYFEIERSKDGHYFEAIGKLSAAGNSEESIEYSYTDERPNSINYYRLRSVDFDESFTRSNVLSANVGQTESGINMYPSPVLSTATINLELAKPGDYTMNVYNISGQLVRSERIMLNESEQISFDANDLNTGLYVIEFQGNDRTFVSEFIKQ
jgi:hypothetical protein